MALVFCRECDKQKSSEAEACPHCGFKGKKKTSAFTWVVTIFIGVPVLVSIMLGASHSGSSSSEVKSAEQTAAEQQKSLDSDRDSYARIIAEREVTKRLKAPSTADFSGFSDTQVVRFMGGGPNKLMVKGYVDAQNGFGAKLRNTYQVVIEFEEGKYDSSRTLSVDLH